MYDAATRRMTIFGGETVGGVNLNDTWVFEDPCPAEADTDGDGACDSIDAFPNDPAETTDSDGDGIGDNADAFPNDPSETTDSDGDGVGDDTDKLDPATGVAELTEEIDALSLDRGLRNSLRSKLDAASASIERGRMNAADGQLGAFVNQVHALRNAGRLDAATADALIAAAEAVRAALAGN